MKVHFLGIGGVGMAALALLMKRAGHDVSGCDGSDSARIAWLCSNGIAVSIGHSCAHIESADMVIATPAVRRDNPERLLAESRGLLCWRGDELAKIVSTRDSIAVCGSHGKTTTSTFIAKLLLALGEDAAWAIGGECGDFHVAGAGTGPLIVEADESDGTLAGYRPSTLVITNCEYDHPDHFKMREEYFAIFDTARKNAKEVIEAEALELTGWDIPVAGEHNKRNARTAIEVALRRGHSREAIMRAIPGVVSRLPDRRFERIAPGVYTDYAHHPTEMRCAISMAREICKGKLRVLFQPHRYSRTKALLNDFPAAFELADEVVLCPTYAAFETPQEGGDIWDLYAKCREHSPRRRFMLAQSCEEALKHAMLESQPGDITLLLGAGDIIKLANSARNPIHAAHGKTDLSHLSFFRTGGASTGGGARIVVGAGSNLWISDLTTDNEYVKSRGIVAKLGASLKIPWMAGIPGTIGGWVKMNAGAFGHSIGEIVSRVCVSGKWLDKEDCRFSYRSSAITGEIEDVEFDEGALAESRREDPAQYLARRKTFPARCCGSVFKNPPGDFAGRILESVGAKCMRIGGAYVWEGHANVIAVDEDATSSDILALAHMLRSRVQYRLGITLEYEICGM